MLLPLDAFSGPGGSASPREPRRPEGAGQAGTGVAKTGGGGGAGAGGKRMGGGSPVALAQRKVGLDSFKIVRVIGKGSFGKVCVDVLCARKLVCRSLFVR